jgi:hypothetical protein
MLFEEASHLAPMPSRSSRPRITAVLASALTLGALAACTSIPRHLDGVPVAPPYTALPLRSWLAEDRIEPTAIVACASDECPQRLAVGVFRASGGEADVLAATLRDPQALARALRQPKLLSPAIRRATRKASPKPRVATAVEARLFDDGDASGFMLALSRADGEGRPAYGAALGRRSGETLEVVLVVGDDEAAVAATAIRVAREDFAR